MLVLGAESYLSRLDVVLGFYWMWGGVWLECGGPSSSQTGPHELVFCRLKLMEAPTPQGHGEGGGLVHLALPCVWCLVLPPKACLGKLPLPDPTPKRPHQTPWQSS